MGVVLQSTRAAAHVIGTCQAYSAEGSRRLPAAVSACFIWDIIEVLTGCKQMRALGLALEPCA